MHSGPCVTLLARVGAIWWPLGALGRSFFTFLKQPGSLFGSFWHHFGRLGSLWPPSRPFWLLSDQEIENYAKNDSKMGSLFGTLLVALGTLGLHVGAL